MVWANVGVIVLPGVRWWCALGASTRGTRVVVMAYPIVRDHGHPYPYDVGTERYICRVAGYVSQGRILIAHYSRRLEGAAIRGRMVTGHMTFACDPVTSFFCFFL